MRHAVLGAGGIGGLLGAALAQADQDVSFLMRPPTLRRYDGRMRVDSAVLGQFEVAVPATSSLEQPVDVLWVTTKATDLLPALALAAADRVGEATVIPLLNGVDHMAILRGSYSHVLAASIRVESERLADGLIRHPSPFLRMDLAAAHPVEADLVAAGITCVVRADELTLLWDKLAFLAPVALATTALDTSLGGARSDARFHGCREEALVIAELAGAHLSAEGVRALHEAAPADLRTSMQKDVEAGREPELDAIAGPILRGGLSHGIPTPHTQALVDAVQERRNRNP